MRNYILLDSPQNESDSKAKFERCKALMLHAYPEFLWPHVLEAVTAIHALPVEEATFDQCVSQARRIAITFDQSIEPGRALI